MDPTAIAAVAAAVVAVTQLLKWAGWFPANLAPLAVLLLAACGVTVWVWSTPTEAGFYREHAFAYFSAWATVSTSAAGVYGFVRAATSADLLGPRRMP